MADEALVKKVQIAFGSTFSFYLKAHNFHWNVTGKDFLQYHDLFGKIYDEVYGSIDDFAEKIRTLDVKVPGSFVGLSQISEILDETNYLDKDAMVTELLADNDKLRNVLKYAYDAAEAAGENGFSNFLAERMDAHAKHGWMLKASL